LRLYDSLLIGAGTWSPDRSDLVLAAGLAICWLLPNTAQILASFRPSCTDAPNGLSFGQRHLVLPSFRLDVAWGVLLGVMSAVAMLGAMRAAPDAFIYFRF